MLRRNDLIYPQECYKIVSVLFEVSNELGYGYQEKYYQRAIARLLRDKSIKFGEQVPITIVLKDGIIGRYFLDFLIEDKIILEIKRGNVFRRSDIQQVYAYLKASNKKLGIIANFTRDGVKYKRIVNLNQG